MMQTENSKMTQEDKKELAIQIKDLEKQIEASIQEGNDPARIQYGKELRKLRRIRDAK